MFKTETLPYSIVFSKLVMPRHIYVLAPPNRLVYELSRRTAKQRHSGWHSAEGQLVKSLSIATNELDEKDLKGGSHIIKSGQNF